MPYRRSMSASDVRIGICASPFAYAVRSWYSISISARRVCNSARIFDNDFVNPKKSSARRKNPRRVRCRQVSRSARPSDRCAPRVSSSATPTVPIVGSPAAAAIPSRIVDFPDPFSPTRKVTAAFTESVSSSRTIGTLNGKRSASSAVAFALAIVRRWTGALLDVLFTRSRASLNRSTLMSLPSRADALALMHEYTASESLRKHMLSVEAAMSADALALMHEYTASESPRQHDLPAEAAMRADAEKRGEDAERWGVAGLIHDFHYERYPNATHSATDEPPAEGVRILRPRGCPDDILQAILGHA